MFMLIKDREKINVHKLYIYYILKFLNLIEFI